MESYDIEKILKDTQADIEKEIEGHMENQPYQITCSVCGADLDIKCTVDDDFDLTVVVDPHICEN